MKKILSLFTLLFAFFGMAWAQDTTKPFKVSDAPTETGWAENTTWYMIRTTEADGGRHAAWLATKGENNATADGILTPRNPNQPTDNSGLWCFVGNDTEGYKIYNKGEGVTKVLGFQGSGNNATAKMYVESDNTEGVTVRYDYVATGVKHPNLDPSKVGCLKLHNSANNYWNNLNGGNYGIHLGLWDNAGAVNGKASTFTFEEVEIEVAKTTLQAAITSAQPYVNLIGKGTGKYTTPEGSQSLNTLIADANEAIRNGDYFTCVDLTNELNTLISGVTLNQPEIGKFYRFCCVNSTEYISQEQVEKKLHTNANVDNATIFYCQTFNGGTKLLAYNNGQYFGNDGRHNFGYLPVGTQTGIKFEYFKANTIGKYTVRQGGNRFICGNDHILDSGDANFDKNDNRYHWAIEEVTTLPVTVSAAGWATLYAPVALTIPTGLTGVYTAAVEGNTLKLKALNGTIPANTPVLIEAAEGKYNFNINYNAAAQTAQAAGKGLSGTLETINKPADKTIYTLQKPAAANNEIGFYKYNGQTLQGFRAYGENLLGTTSTAEGLIFDKGDVTAIENVEINDGKQTVIYDLSGRRVEKMLKGIYIVNGKKVIK